MPFLFSYDDKSGIFSLPRSNLFYPQKLSPGEYTHIPNLIRKEQSAVHKRERVWNIPSFLEETNRGNTCMGKRHWWYQWDHGSRKLAASMTIEASLCLTLFLVFMISLCQLFLVMQLQLRIQKALEQVGSEVAQYSYLTSQISLWDSDSRLVEQVQEYLLAELSQEAVRLRFVDVMGATALNQSILVGGAEGVSFDDSQILQEHHRLRLVVSYQVRLPITLWGWEDITMKQQCYRYALLGDQLPSQSRETEKTMVYVTKYGEVYHTTLACSHLNLSVRSVSMSQVKELRNAGGGCYDACELCQPTGWEAAVYLTEEGDRYHDELECSGIRRHITSVPLEEASQMRACSRCGDKS